MIRIGDIRATEEKNTIVKVIGICGSRYSVQIVDGWNLGLSYNYFEEDLNIAYPLFIRHSTPKKKKIREVNPVVCLESSSIRLFNDFIFYDVYVSRNKIKIIANGREGAIGIAKCHKHDAFNYEFGKKLALYRMLENWFSNKIKNMS